ncbi:MAG: YfcE family phosphodiesterase [Proteobacteria bacterium]|nr:YfcE family phosphodiesterase [Pseudomonadota bacterium]
MARLIITADIHGFYSAWQKIVNVLNSDDSLVVAGDFFDTRYGKHSEPDYLPEIIRKEFTHLNIPKYYVYGNCDQPAFFPGYDFWETFLFQGKKILLTHGHYHLPENNGYDIRIQGHTHAGLIQQKSDGIFINPGSISLPRDNFKSYAVIEGHHIRLVDIDKGVLEEHGFS